MQPTPFTPSLLTDSLSLTGNLLASWAWDGTVLGERHRQAAIRQDYQRQVYQGIPSLWRDLGETLGT